MIHAIVAICLLLPGLPGRQDDGIQVVQAPRLADPKFDRMFKDVDTSEWPYAATQTLLEDGAVWGYPHAYFRGKSALTRYEFAVALDRALQSIEQHVRARIPSSAAGARTWLPQGFQPRDARLLMRLTEEFTAELEAMGNTRELQDRVILALLDAWETSETTGIEFVPPRPSTPLSIRPPSRAPVNEWTYITADERLFGPSTASTRFVLMPVARARASVRPNRKQNAGAQ